MVRGSCGAMNDTYIRNGVDASVCRSRSIAASQNSRLECTPARIPSPRRTRTSFEESQSGTCGNVPA